MPHHDKRRYVYALALVTGGWLLYLSLGGRLGSGPGLGTMVMGALLVVSSEALALKRSWKLFGVGLALLAVGILGVPLAYGMFWFLLALVWGQCGWGFECGSFGMLLAAVAGGTWAALRWATYRLARRADTGLPDEDGEPP